MQVVPKGSPSLASENNAQASNAAQSARDRALAILSGSKAPQDAPISVPNTEPEPVVSTQAHTSEVPAEAPSEPAKVEEPISPQLALLARKEKALRQQAQQIKTERDAIKAKEAEMERSYQLKLSEAEKSWKSKLSDDPLAYLNESGVSYDDLTSRLLNAPKPEDQARDQYTKKLEARLADLESRQEKQAKTYEEQQSNQYQQALSQIKADVTSLVTNDPEFETIKGTDSIGDVVELIEKTFKADGVLLTVEEAAKAVEDHLVEEFLKYSKIGKLSKRLQPAPVAAKPNPGEKSLESSKQPQSKTLTNNMGSTRALTPRERALLAFEGKLKA